MWNYRIDLVITGVAGDESGDGSITEILVDNRRDVVVQHRVLSQILVKSFKKMYYVEAGIYEKIGSKSAVEENYIPGFFLDLRLGLAASKYVIQYSA